MTLGIFGPKWRTLASIEIVIDTDRPMTGLVSRVPNEEFSGVPYYLLITMLGSVQLLRNFTSNCRTVAASTYRDLASEMQRNPTYNGDLSRLLTRFSPALAVDDPCASGLKGPKFRVLLQTDGKEMVTVEIKIPLLGDQNEMHRTAIQSLFEWGRLQAEPRGDFYCKGVALLLLGMSERGRQDYATDVGLGYAAAQIIWEEMRNPDAFETPAREEVRLVESERNPSTKVAEMESEFEAPPWDYIPSEAE